MASIQKRDSGRWRARYRDAAGKEHARHFDRRIDAQRRLDEVTASVVTGTYTPPSTARLTEAAWCDQWLAGYASNKPSTVRQARTHVAKIKEGPGDTFLVGLKPSHVSNWVAQVKAAGHADSYVCALHARLAQICTEAVHDGLIPRSPCSRRTAPSAGKQRAFVATTEQVWALHDAMPEHLRPAVLLGAFAALRTAEVCGLRVSDVDFMRGIVHPAVQYPAEPLKTERSRSAIPIPRNLALEFAAHVKKHYTESTLVTTELQKQVGPWRLDRAVRAAREDADQPGESRFHDLRHYYASMLIASGSDVKIVQARMRHASAKTTLDVYGHLWPDTEESTRAAVETVLAARADSLRTATVSG